MLLTRWARLAGLVALVALPAFSTDQTVLGYADLFLIYGVAVLGLSIQQGMGGILNLGPGATLGVGAYAAAVVSHHMRWPMPLPLLAAVAVAPPCALLFGGAALLLSRVHFAMLSLYAALLVPVLAAHGGSVTGGTNGLTDLEPLEIAGWRPVGLQLYAVLAAVLVVAAAVCTRTCEGRWGRAFLAVRDDETAAASLGIPLFGARMRAVTLAALYGSVAGALLVHAWPGTCPSGYAGATCVITPDYFGLDLSALLFAAATIGGSGSRAGPLAALAGLVVVRWYFDTHDTVSGDWETVVFGAVLVASVVAVPGGVAAGLRRVQPRPARGAPLRPVPGPVSPPVRSRPGAALGVRGLRVAFGGSIALDGVDLDVRPGQVHAVIGPNGSGKTTLLNCIAGGQRPAAGRIVLDGTTLPNVAPRRAHLRARLGIARTFQTPRIQPDLGVVENVMQGLFVEAPAGLTWPLRDDEPRWRRRAEEMVVTVGLGHRLAGRGGDLPHGERRLLELARALVSGPAVLLLDEPAAGLDSEETERLVGLLQACRAWGRSVVVVDHHLDLVLDTADAVTVLEHGRVVASGPPGRVRDDPALLRAFMGPP